MQIRFNSDNRRFIDALLGMARSGALSGARSGARWRDLPVRFGAWPGQENDMTQACDLITGLEADYRMAERAYDSDKFMDLIYDQGGQPVIAPRKHRKFQHHYDKDLYKERNQVERLFVKLKAFRHVTTPGWDGAFRFNSLCEKSRVYHQYALNFSLDLVAQ